MIASDSGGAGQAVGHVVAVQGATVTGQLLDQSPVGLPPVVIGDLVAMPTGKGRAYGVVNGLRRGRRGEDRPAVDMQLLGEIAREQRQPFFRRGVRAFPALDAEILRAGREETAVVYAQPAAAHVRVGRLRHDSGLPACLATDSLLGKSLAILGSTGSGKSCAVAVVLRALLNAYPFAHVLVIDPHNEYAAALGDRALRLDPGNLELPYWLLTFEEIAVVLTSGGDGRAYAEGAILRDAIVRAKHLYAGPEAAEASHITVDTPVPYRLSDLSAVIEAGMGTLNKPEGAAAYRHLLSRLASVR
jgi:hypothetical protein